MFGGGTSNTYDDVVAKTTDENLTTENWELILNVCDKVTDEGDEGARNVVASVLKRLAHRNPNVQLYALSLMEALSKNCGLSVNREIASRAFTQGLERLVTDRTTHDKVRKRILGLISQWTSEFEEDTSLGIMEDCYNNLKAKGYKFEVPQEPLPPTVDDEIRRKEEEELQRVLEMSMQDKGGRGQWAEYTLASSSGAGGSASASGGVGGGTSGIASGTGYTEPKYPSGYLPARTPSPQHQYRYPSSSPTHGQATTQHYTHSNASKTSSFSATPGPTHTTSPSTPIATATASPGSAINTSTTAPSIVTRVRALHTFRPTEPGELAFEKGEIIKVVDRGYKDWWRGQLKGRTGIFPVNYVEPMPEPTASELAKEAQQEAEVFAQAVNVEKLLNLLRAFDPTKDNLADNEEIQELYRSSMALRPKIVKLIDKYSQKRADLVSMNETFVRARTIFDRMMEESLARHTGVYDQSSYRPAYGPIRPDSRTTARGPNEYVQPPAVTPAPQGYGWNQGQGSYAYTPTSSMSTAFPEPTYPAATPTPGPPATGGGAPGVYGYPTPGQQVPFAPASTSVPYGIQGTQPYPAQTQAQPAPQAQPLQTQPQSQPQVQPLQQHHQTQQGQTQQPQYQAQQGPPQQSQHQIQQGQPQQPLGPQIDATGVHSQVPTESQTQARPQYGQSPYAPQAPEQQQPYQPQVDYAAQGQPQKNEVEFQPQPQLQPLQVQAQPQPTEAQPQPQPQSALQAEPTHAQPQQSQQLDQPVQQMQQNQQHQNQPAGPPYIFDPKATYPDPNVQAWAQYYAQGGKDPAGAVYFVSVPGVKEGPADVQRPYQQQPDQHQHSPQSQFHQATHISAAAAPSSYGSQSPVRYQNQDQPDNKSTTSLGSNSGQIQGGYGQANLPGPQANTSMLATSQGTGSPTPSWVLPKKDGGRSSHLGGPLGSTASGSGINGLTGQFGGFSLADPGNGSTGT